MAVADELIAILGYKLEGEENVKKYEQNLKNVEKAAQRVGAAIGTFISWAGAAAVAGFGFLGTSAIKATATFEGYSIALETIEGSAEKAKASMAWIAEFAKVTPYELDGVTEAFIKLKAYGIDPMANDTLKTLGDTASSMNKPLNMAVEAFADAATMQFERLKEFGIKAEQKGDEVTFSWTENGKEMEKKVKKNAAEVKKFLLDTWGGKFKDAMDRQSKSFNGMMSNLTDSWDAFKRRIGEAGYFDNVKNKLKEILDSIDFLEKSGKLDKWARGLSAAFSAVADMLYKVGRRTFENLAFLADNLERLRTPILIIAGLFGFLIARAFPVITFFSLLALVLDDFLAYLQGAESVFGRFVDWLQRTTGAGKELSEWLAGFAGVLAAAFATGLVLKPLGFLKAFAGVLYAALAGLNAVIYSGLTAAFALLSNPIGWGIILAGVGAALVWYFWDDIKKAWSSIGWSELGTGMGNGILEGLQSVGSQITAWLDSILPSWARDWIFGAGAQGAPAVGVGASQPQADTSLPRGQAGSSPMEGDALDFKFEQQRQEWERVFGNLNENLARMMPENAVEATVTDSRQDNRQFPFTANVTVNQSVTQATNAPGQAAQATGQAVAGAVASQRSQIETEPSF